MSYSYCVADGLRLVQVCRGGWSVCLFGEKIQPVLQILLTVTRHLHPLTLAACHHKRKTKSVTA